VVARRPKRRIGPRARRALHDLVRGVTVCQYSTLRLGYTPDRSWALGMTGTKPAASSPESSLCVGEPSSRGKFMLRDDRPHSPSPALLAFITSRFEWRSSSEAGFGSSRFLLTGAC
jgi:hypothetical protein